MSIKNSVTLVGNVGQDPELKTTSNGKSYLQVSIAVNKSYKDKDGDKKTITNWFQFTLWEKQAETLSKYLKKGMLIGIDGELATQKRDVNGVDITVNEIRVNNVEMLPSSNGKKDDQQESKSSKGKGKREEAEEPAYADDNVNY